MWLCWAGAACDLKRDRDSPLRLVFYDVGLMLTVMMMMMKPAPPGSVGDSVRVTHVKCSGWVAAPIMTTLLITLFGFVA